MGVYGEQPLKFIRAFFLPSTFGQKEPNEERFTPPPPLSPPFWRCYGEPVSAIAYWCRKFTECIDCMSLWQGRDAAEADVQYAFTNLSALADSAAPAFRFNPKRNALDEARVSPGLIASYALMFLWDRMEGRRALRCQNCQAYFVSDETRARYCSPRCRNTAQARRYRSQKDGTK